MASCNFNIQLNGDPATTLDKARAAIEGQGGQFNGNLEKGDFHVSVFGNTIAGSYTMTGNEINILVTDKPFLIPCSTIEGFLRSKLA